MVGLGCTRLGATLAMAAIAALVLLSARAIAAPRADWSAYNGSPEQQHWSPLAQIDATNVAKLRVAWTYDTNDAFPGGDLQCNPLVVDGVLYGVTPRGAVIALDAATGALRWKWDAAPERKPLGRLRIRGLARWTDGRDERLFVGVRGRLYSIDARTGRADERFGERGSIDLRAGLGPRTADMPVTLTSPGVVYRNLLVIGSVVSELPPAAPGDIRAIDVRTGRIAWTFRTIPADGEPGSETWPAPGAREYSGAANNWAGMSVDVRRGIVYVPTGSPTYDYYGGNRAGDNLYGNTLLALDARTGRRVWHFQSVRHDLWDRDLGSPPTLVDVRRNGRTVPAVAQPTKTGFLFLFDRRDGMPLFPIDEVPIPASTLPGERSAATLPVPRVPEPFARQRVDEASLTRRTPEAYAAAKKQFDSLLSGPWYTPGTLQGAIIMPGIDGGAEWGGSAVDPRTRVLYVNANDVPWIHRMIERPRGEAMTGKAIYDAECATCHGPDRAGRPPEFPSLLGLADRLAEAEVQDLIVRGNGRMPGFGRLGWSKLLALGDYVMYGRDTAVSATAPVPATVTAPARASTTAAAAAAASSGTSGSSLPPYIMGGYRKLVDDEGYPGAAPPWGTLNAIDLDTGRYLWRVPLGEYPKLAAQGVPTTGTENYGGPVVTAGGLVFIGATIHDRKFRAFDARTGALLWETTLPVGGTATPAVYSVRGRQYVVIAAGSGRVPGEPKASYVAFALPDDAPSAGASLREPAR